MLTHIKQLLTPPAFENHTKNYQARLLNFIVLMILLTLTLPFLSVTFTFQQPLLGLIPIAAMYLLCFVVIIIMRKGYVKFAGILFISAAWIMITLSSIFFSGVHSNSFNFLFLSILVAGLLFGWRAGIVFAGLSILAGLVLVIAELYGVLPQSMSTFTVWHIWVNKMAVFILGAILVLIAIRNLNNALEQADKNEQVLTEERNLLRTLIDNLPDYIYVKDTQSRFVVNNLNHIHAMGAASQEEVIGKTDADLFPKERAKEFYADEQKIFTLGQPLINKEEKTRDYHKNKDIWVATTKVPFTDSQGNIIGLVGISRDVTEQKQTEEELRKYRHHLEQLVEERTAKLTIANQHLLQKIVEHEQTELELQQQRDFAMKVMNALGQGVSVTNEASQFEYINPAFVRILGYSPEEILGKTPADFTPPEDRGILRKARRARNNGRTTSYEQRVQRADGTIIHTLVTGVPRWQEDQIVGTIAITTDLTEHKQIEEALRESEERFRQAVTSISDHIYITEITGDGEHINLYVSPNVEALTGYAKEKIMNNRFFWPTVVIHPEDRDIAAAQAAKLDVGRHSQTEYRMVKADGQTIWVRDSARVESKGTSKIIYGVVSDITAHKNLEEQLRQSQKMEAIGQLAGGVAHDFNNILTVITGTCDLVLYGLKNDSSLYQDIYQIKEAAKRASALTHQLLAFGRQQILQPKVIDLNKTIASAENILKRLIGEDINFNIAPNPQPGYIKVDPTQIEQIIFNLVVNARDAMPDGGTLTIETKNTDVDDSYAHQHVDVAPGPYVMLAISDTGQGMDTETLNRIFEPFFTTKEYGKGTGLGLATVHGIVKQSNGHIWVYSEPDQGSTFKVYFPRVGQNGRLISLDETDVETQPGTETVLLVEDEEMVRELAYRILLRGGYEVLEAQNGTQALEISKQHKNRIDLLLTDVVMPGGVSGRQLVEQLTSHRADMKVLYMSGYTDDAAVQHGILDSGIAFLQKPFTPDTLLHKVREILDSNRS